MRPGEVFVIKLTKYRIRRMKKKQEAEQEGDRGLTGG